MIGWLVPVVMVVQNSVTIHTFQLIPNRIERLPMSVLLMTTLISLFILRACRKLSPWSRGRPDVDGTP